MNGRTVHDARRVTNNDDRRKLRVTRLYQRRARHRTRQCELDVDIVVRTRTHGVADPLRVRRRQLCIKGRNLTVGQLVSTLRANRMTPEQASDNLDLPLAAICEALTYYAENHGLIELEASEERRRLAQRGLPLEPKDLSR